jgi:ATP-dependent DNA ligase
MLLGEAVSELGSAPDEDGRPNFLRLSPRILHGRPGIHVTYIVFDVLRVEGMSTMDNTYEERHRLLDELDLQSAHWCTPPVFDGGTALFADKLELAQSRRCIRRIFI